jgi:hypothetical protein
MRGFFSNFIFRLMAIHFIAFCLFIYAFQVLAFLHDYSFLFSLTEHINRVNFPEKFNADMEFVVQAGNIGLLVAYVISWIISNKQNWHWINSVVIFLLAFLLKNFALSSALDKVLLSPGGPFKIYSFTGHILTGIILIAIGLVLFLSKRIIRFIDSANKANKKAAVTHKAAAIAKGRGAK